jgi:two-component system, OmpR family, sensor kinase
VIVSLRARLIAALLAIGAVGLLLLGGITYAEQRSFLFDRVDGLAKAAIEPVNDALGGRGIGPRGHGDEVGPRPGDDLGDHRRAGLPSGTYGQRRAATGTVIGGGFLVDVGQGSASVPQLPRRMAPGSLQTVQSANGTRYRTYASSAPAGSGLTIAAVPLTEADQTLRRLLVVEGLVIAGVLVALGTVSWLVVRVGLLPLDRIGHTASAIASGDLARRVEPSDQRTEVGRLGAALNAMLDRLERAFAERRASEERLRRFAADASHELRTPLASIRGYAELHRMGAATSPAEVEKAMRRIEDEAARMGVLVDDLLTLARLDQVAEAPHAPVDLGALARDAADDARATAPGRSITVDLRGPALVMGDAHQLRQVLANLVRNALVHTPVGTPVEIAVASEHGDVRLTVRDHGAGLPAGAQGGALFERFWRAEPGRGRGRAGAGLGLAIVAGIVEAHGGAVGARDAAGEGAVFEVRLPAATRPHAGAPARV